MLIPFSANKVVNIFQKDCTVHFRGFESCNNVVVDLEMCFLLQVILYMHFFVLQQKLTFMWFKKI